MSVESNHYGCTPVILSNYCDLPFNDILDWRKFALVLNERDVYNLKQILKNISDDEFVRLHNNLVKIQKHFQWNSPPIKFDHMISGCATTLLNTSRLLDMGCQLPLEVVHLMKGNLMLDMVLFSCCAQGSHCKACSCCSCACVKTCSVIKYEVKQSNIGNAIQACVI